MKDNRRKFLAEIVSIDSWHEPIKINENTAGVFVELSFREGRIGGDDPSVPFTFKISLRKAALIIKLENPISFDRNSVARTIPKNTAEYTQVRNAKDSIEKNLKGGFGVDSEKFSIAMNGSIAKSSTDSREDSLKIVQTIPEIMVTPFPEGGNAYSWTLEPTWRDFLRGQPWDPTETPRMRVGVRGSAPAIEPVISVEIRCAFEDLHIYDIETKSDSFLGLVKDEMFGLTNQKAAIQHLKRMLCESDLHPTAMDNRFNEVLLASLISMES